jgi:hypothetical protein
LSEKGERSIDRDSAEGRLLDGLGAEGRIVFSNGSGARWCVVFRNGHGAGGVDGAEIAGFGGGVGWHLVGVSGAGVMAAGGGAFSGKAT